MTRRWYSSTNTSPLPNASTASEEQRSDANSRAGRFPSRQSNERCGQLGATIFLTEGGGQLLRSLDDAHAAAAAAVGGLEHQRIAHARSCGTRLRGIEHSLLRATDHRDAALRREMSVASVGSSDQGGMSSAGQTNHEVLLAVREKCDDLLLYDMTHSGRGKYTRTDNSYLECTLTK